MKTITCIALLLACSAAVAGPKHTSQNRPGGCDYHDAWRGPDKNQHAAAGALIGGAVTLYTGDWRYGVGVSAAAGIAKELTGYCSAQDAIATFAGGLIGSAIGHGISLTLDPERKYVWIGFRKDWK